MQCGQRRPSCAGRMVYPREHHVRPLETLTMRVSHGHPSSRGARPILLRARAKSLCEARKPMLGGHERREHLVLEIGVGGDAA